MKRRRWPWVLLGLVALLVAGIATLPAELAWRYLLAGQLNGVEMAGLNGSVWRGSATELRVRGISVGALSWQLDSLALLQLAPRLDAQVSGSAVQARLQVQRLPSKALQLRNVSASLDAAWLAPVLALPLLIPQGQVQLDVSRLDIDPDGVPQAGDLNLLWHSAALTGAAQADLGEVSISARGEARRWLGTISNPAGSALSIDGGFSLVDRRYSAEIRLRANNPDDPVVKVLPLIGQPQPDGSQLLRIEGELLPLGPA